MSSSIDYLLPFIGSTACGDTITLMQLEEHWCQVSALECVCQRMSRGAAESGDNSRNSRGMGWEANIPWQKRIQLIKSLSTAVYYSRSHDHEAHCGNYCINPQDCYCSFGDQSHKEELKMTERIRRHLGLTVPHKGELCLKKRCKSQSPKFCLYQNIAR